MLCLCGQDSGLSCPVCDVALQLQTPGDPDDPLWPTASGKAASKEGMTATWKHFAILAGVPPEQAENITGHLPRVAGAMFLASLGVDESLIMALARWGSEAVRGYMRLSPQWAASRVTLDAASALAQRAALQRATDQVLGIDWRTGGPVPAGPDQALVHPAPAGGSAHQQAPSVCAMPCAYVECHPRPRWLERGCEEKFCLACCQNHDCLIYRRTSTPRERPPLACKGCGLTLKVAREERERRVKSAAGCIGASDNRSIISWEAVDKEQVIVNAKTGTAHALLLDPVGAPRDNGAGGPTAACGYRPGPTAEKAFLAPLQEASSSPRCGKRCAEFLAVLAPFPEDGPTTTPQLVADSGSSEATSSSGSSEED